MAKRKQKILNLNSKICRMGKISNNVEHHGDEYVPAFTIPITGIMLDKTELNRFMNDSLTYASWFDTTGSVKKPMSWWGEETFRISPDYEADALTITLSGKRVIKFDSIDGDDEDDGRAACTLSKITLTPMMGGLTEMSFHLYVLPDIGKTNLLLQEHQHREITITLEEGKAVEKKTKQPELPMDVPDAESAPTNLQ